MKKCLSLVALLVACGLISAGGSVKSGPQVGENARPKPFFPLNLNGPTPDKKECLVCRNGNNPVAMVFARDTSPELITLMAKLDAETVKNADKKMGSFAIFCNDADGLCYQVGSIGQSCNGNAWCYSGICLAGKCFEPELCDF